MKFLLRTWSSNGDYDADIAAAVVDIDRDYARQIVKRIALFEHLKAEDDTAHEIYFWDYHANYASNADVEYDSGPDFVETTIEVAAMNMECDQMVVRGDGVCWTAMPKHTDIYITTGEIPWAKIRELASDNLDRMEGAVGKPRRRSKRVRS